MHTLDWKTKTALLTAGILLCGAYGVSMEHAADTYHDDIIAYETKLRDYNHLAHELGQHEKTMPTDTVPGGEWRTSVWRDGQQRLARQSAVLDTSLAQARTKLDREQRDRYATLVKQAHTLHVPLADEALPLAQRIDVLTARVSHARQEQDRRRREARANIGEAQNVQASTSVDAPALDSDAAYATVPQYAQSAQTVGQQYAQTTVRPQASAPAQAAPTASAPQSAGGYATSSTCAIEGAYTCQERVDQGGLVDLSAYGGATHVFAQHNSTGGDWINQLTPGQRVTIDGKQFTVNDYNDPNATIAPPSGYYAQTCHDGNQRRLVGLTPVG